MLLFLDNDIILKLGALGLLQELENLFNTDASSIYVLPTTKHYISKNKKLRNKYSEELLHNILKVISNYQTIPDDFVNDQKYLSLADIDKIDSGERILFSLKPSVEDFLILTSDKNSIVQLNNQKQLQDIKRDLREKIVCLEYIVLKLIEINSFDFIKKRMNENDYGGDTTLKQIFNQSNLTQEMAREGLLSYYNDLKRNTDNLLL